MKILLISLLSTILFGVIDALFFLYFEEMFNDKLKYYYNDRIVRVLLIGGISASISIFFANFLEQVLSHYFTITENPLLDSIGILIGTFIIITLYKHNFLKKI